MLISALVIKVAYKTFLKSYYNKQSMPSVNIFHINLNICLVLFNI